MLHVKNAMYCFCDIYSNGARSVLTQRNKKTKKQKKCKILSRITGVGDLVDFPEAGKVGDVERHGDSDPWCG